MFSKKRIDDPEDAMRRYDFASAIRIWSPMADHGDAVAQLSLGEIYWNGMGTPRDSEKAIGLFRSAADNGYVPAMRRMGLCYYDTIKHPETLAERGNPQIPTDLQQAIFWWRKAADLGDTWSMRRIGYMIANGIGFEESVSDGLAWHKKAAEHGDAEAAMYVARVEPYPQVSDPISFPWYKRAAELGHSNAQIIVGEAYEFGYFGQKIDVKEAFYWYDQAMKAGNGKAAFHLIDFYRDGIVVPRDMSKARFYSRLYDRFKRTGELDARGPLWFRF